MATPLRAALSVGAARRQLSQRESRVGSFPARLPVVSELYEAHPLPPPMLQHFLGEIAYRHGRGTNLYSLIPKGEARPPPLATPLI